MRVRVSSLRIITVLALTGLVPGLARASDLLNAYHQAQQQDTTLQAALAQRDASIETRPQALAAFLPQLDANANLQRQKEVLDGTDQSVSTQPGTSLPPGSNAAVTGQGTLFGNSSTYGLTLNQTIWSFQSFHKLQEANLQVAQAEATYRGAQQSLILRVAQAYFNVLAAADTLRTNQLEQAAYGELLRQEKSRVDNGLSAQTGLKEDQSYFDANAANLIDAETALDDAKRALAELTDVQPRDLATLRDEIPLALPTPAQPEDWVSTAMQDNFDLRAAQLQADAAQRDISANRAKAFPTLSLQGSLNKYDYSNDLGTNERLNGVGVVFDWPLFQGGTVLSLVRQAKATYAQYLAQYEGSRRSVERQARLAYRGVVAGIDKIKANRQAAESNRTAVEASRLGVEFGTRSEFELLEAQTNYYNVLRSYYQSRYDYLTNVLTLKQLAGRLTEADLAEIDGLLEKDAAPAEVPSGTPSLAPTQAPAPGPQAPVSASPTPASSMPTASNTPLKSASLHKTACTHSEVREGMQPSGVSGVISLRLIKKPSPNPFLWM